MPYRDDASESPSMRSRAINGTTERGNSRSYRDDINDNNDDDSSDNEYFVDDNEDFQIIGGETPPNNNTTNNKRWRKDGFWKVYSSIGFILFCTLVLFVSVKDTSQHQHQQQGSSGNNSSNNDIAPEKIKSSHTKHFFSKPTIATERPTTRIPTRVPTKQPTTRRPTNIPTQHPTKTPRVQLTIPSLISYFTPVSGFAAMLNTSSPQYKIIEWIVHNGLYDMHNELLDVYVLGTLYYSLDGSNWRERDNYLNPNASVCEWHKGDSNGAYCDKKSTSAAAISKIIFSSNHLSGTIPTEIHYLSNLNQLHLTYGSIHGTIPSEIGLLSNLDQLNLNVNRITGTIPSEIGRIGRTKNKDELSIRLDNNRLVGTIPSEIGEIIGLSKLLLNNNQFIGTMPAKELSQLPLLTILNVAQNYLEGNVMMDFDFGSLSSLERLYLESNQFMGSIPSTIGLLRKDKMHIIKLNNNDFHGTIPSEIGLLNKLEKFWFQGNFVIGDVNSILCVPGSFEALVARADSCANSSPKRITCQCCCCGEYACD